MNNLADFPDNSRIWFFPLKEALNEEQTLELYSALQGFIAGWQAHKQQLTAGAVVLANQVVLVVADDEKVKASGCSIDALTRSVEGIVRELGSEIARASEVLYFRGSSAICCSRAEFQRLAEQGEVTPETEVFNGMLSSLSEVRAGAWRCPARQSWHGAAFW
jgi:hypothetical protein